MKHAYMINGVGGRCLAFVAAFSLCACSVLQVDVDEYKGALSNHEDIQLQQYAALATSAKPIIVALRNNYIFDDDSYDSEKNSNREDKEKDRNCLTGNADDMDDYIGCTFKLDIAYFLNSILALYEDTKSLQGKIEGINQQIDKQNQDAAAARDKEIKITNQQPITKQTSTSRSRPQKKGLPAEDEARDDVGITQLTKNFIEATENANKRQDESTLNKLRIAKERLNNALIIFAEKILYTVNNHQLANGSTGKESYAKKLAVLQSLGNTLVTHADDLRKRAAHNQRLEDRKDSELAAAQQAFAPGAQNSFDNLVGDLEASVRQKGSRELILGSAIHEFDKTITKDSIKDLEKKLETAAQKVQPTLNAYRTAFGDYDFGIGGVIPAEDSSAVKDRGDIAGLFKKDDPVTMDAVLTTLESWFDESKITPQGELLPADPKYNRRNCAKTAFDKFKSKLFQQDFEVKGTETELFKKLGDRFLVKLNEEKLNLTKDQKKITDKNHALEENEKNIAEKEKVAGDKGQLEKTLTAVKSIKQAVLQQAEIAKVVDFSGLRHLLLLEIKKQQSEPGTNETKVEEFKAAHDMLAAMSIPKSLQFVGGSHVKTQRDVLDDVIAQLQQQRLEAASRGADITALSTALELAYEQRGGLAYIRSANAYLRNAFANTSVQDSNGSTSCYNLLLPSRCDNTNRAFRDTKLEIDKQFWQNINTVKVRGGGTTDFAIVKDDVGNWYVKGLSSDPESIIKSAQSLALFNMGGKVDLNLLGQAETRRKLAKLDVNDSRRKTLQDELKEQQSGSGANTAALGKVLAKYRQEYVGATTMDVEDLIGKLNQLPTDITAAWQGINFGEANKEARFKILRDLLGAPAELATAQKALEAAKADLANVARPAAQASSTATALASAQKNLAADPAKGTAPASGSAKDTSEAANSRAADAIVKSLVEVRNMRSRLVKAIIQNDEFIAAQREAYEGAKADLKVKDGTVAEKKKEWEKANKNVTDKQASLDAMTVPAEIEKQQRTLTAAKEALKIAQVALDKARNKHDEAVRGARENLSKVFKGKQKAQDNVNSALQAKPVDQKQLDDAKAVLVAEEAKLVAAEQELAKIMIPSEEVNTTTDVRDKAKEKLAIEEGVFNNLTASSAIEQARAGLTLAKGALDTAKIGWEGAESELAGLRIAAKQAEDAYTLAKSNRLAAARKVTMSANSLIETTAANRLEAVKAYEVAIGFVGQTAGGQ